MTEYTGTGERAAPPYAVTAAALLADCRAALGDTGDPPTWDDDELLIFLNEAIREYSQHLPRLAETRLAAVAGAMRRAVSVQHTWPLAWLTRMMALPLPSGSPGPGTSLAPHREVVRRLKSPGAAKAAVAMARVSNRANRTSSRVGIRLVDTGQISSLQMAGRPRTNTGCRWRPVYRRDDEESDGGRGVPAWKVGASYHCVLA